MRNAKRRLLSIILAISMVVALVPSAFAAEATGADTVETTDVGGLMPPVAIPDGSVETSVTAEEDTQPTEISDTSDEAPEVPEGDTAEPVEAVDEIAQLIQDGVFSGDELLEVGVTGSNMEAAGVTAIAQATTDMAPGVSYKKIITRNANNQQNVGFLTEVDLSQSVKLKASYAGYYTANSTEQSREAASANLGWGFASTTAQAAAYESTADTEGTVVMATNADYFNMGTGEPLGYLIMEGNVLKASDEPYFAILKDGTAVIRDAGTDCSDVEEAISGPFYLIRDGVNVSADDGSVMPINSVGIRADGSVVFFLNDGRQSPYSFGMTLTELTSLLLDEGCVTALYLDGGGSATVAARAEGTDALAVINSPSDGHERDVSSAMLVVSTATPDGVFDHASITPREELYTPGSTVQFSAVAVDGAGAAVEMPSDVVWALAEGSKNMGTIDTNGLFTAGTTTGEVTVILSQNGKTVGSATIEIAVPDKIGFETDEVSLGFEATSDFGISVTYKNQDIHYKDGDLIWTLSDEKMGTFTGNIFTSSDGESLTGTVTATSKFDENVSGTITLIVGKLPTIVWDFEDVVLEDGTVVPAEQYYTIDAGEGTYFTTGNYGRGGVQSAEIVSIDDEEPVRMGSKALKINYDFTQCGEVTEGAIFGTTDAFEIPGMPTAIGVWVYAPEGTGVLWEGDGTTSGLWLRGYVNGNLPYNFTFEPKDFSGDPSTWPDEYPGIWWEGWRYLEADLSNIQGPYSILKGNTFRIMYVAGTKMGEKTAGSLYFDNFQFVYGTNVEDTELPRVDSITIANKELEDGATLTTNTISLRTTFSDTPGKYSSGVDSSTVRMFVDGVNVVTTEGYNYALNASDGYAELYDLKLADGEHSITISLRDNNGNENKKTVYFTVNTGATAQTSVSVVAKENAAMLGGAVNLEIWASDSTVQTSETKIHLSKMFPDYQVVFGENYEGTYTWSKADTAVTINATRKAAASKDVLAAEGELIATLVVQVPATMTAEEKFVYSVMKGVYTTSGETQGTFTAQNKNLAIGEGIKISYAPILVGETAAIHVVDLEGKGVAGAGIYLDDGTLIGTTDETGVLTTDYFSAAAGEVRVYAQSQDGLLSFRYKVETFDGTGDLSGMPSQVKFNASNAATQKNISWMSHPQAVDQYIRYRVKGSDQDVWVMKKAQTELHTYTVDKKAVNINSVVVSGLQAGTTYIYQIGNGTVWTNEAEFTTAAAAAQKFFVISDIQAEDTTNLNKVLAEVAAGDYNFGIQTGDAVDNVTNYAEVSGVMDLLGANTLGDTDMVHALGNHEYYGDQNAEMASAMYNLNLTENKPGSCYSVTYGDVYVAVINYTNTTAELQTALEWLVSDAKASDATWKVLALHQPPYYTNATGGNMPINMYVPAAAEEAGIDVVFSGHDHSLARTNPLTDGEQDNENGILYYIGGSSGEKSYEINSQSVFDYDKTFAVVTTDFVASYISVTADDYKMVLDIRDMTDSGESQLLDRYTLYTKKGACEAAGHELEEATYQDGKLICNNCGDAVDPAVAKYSGLAIDAKTGRYMLFVAGAIQTGKNPYGDETYYFDKNGVAYEGKVVIDEVELEFKNGLLIGGYSGFIKKADGETYYYKNGVMIYGWYEVEGYYYHFNTETGAMLHSEKHIRPDDEAYSKNAYYDFGEDGKLLSAYFNPKGYYYWAGAALANAWVQPAEDPTNWYRTNSHGHYVTDSKSGAATVVIAIDDVEYTFDNTNGKLLKGSIVSEGGKLYYYWVGEPVNDGWFILDGDTYYAYEDGHLARGIHKINGEVYVFGVNGKLVARNPVMSVALGENNETMTIKVVNSDTAITGLRAAIWPTHTGQEGYLQWHDMEKDAEGMWVLTIPMCAFEMTTADDFTIHVFNGTELLTEGFVEVPVAATHRYTDDKDASCNVCGAEREIVVDRVPTVPMYRLYNPNTGEHFYTGSTEERDILADLGWDYEGVAWNAPIYGGTPIHRFCNPNTGDHHYTASQQEMDDLTEAGWVYEGVAWNSASPREGNIPQFRMYNPNAVTGTHHYTSSEEERDMLVAEGWNYEGIGWYGTLK